MSQSRRASQDDDEDAGPGDTDQRRRKRSNSLVTVELLYNHQDNPDLALSPVKQELLRMASYADVLGILENI